MSVKNGNNGSRGIVGTLLSQGKGGVRKLNAPGYEELYRTLDEITILAPSVHQLFWQKVRLGLVDQESDVDQFCSKLEIDPVVANFWKVHLARPIRKIDR